MSQVPLPAQRMWWNHHRAAPPCGPDVRL